MKNLLSSMRKQGLFRRHHESAPRICAKSTAELLPVIQHNLFSVEIRSSVSCEPRTPPYKCARAPRQASARCDKRSACLPATPFFSHSCAHFAQTSRFKNAVSLLFSWRCAHLQKEWGMATPPPLPLSLFCMNVRLIFFVFSWLRTLARNTRAVPQRESRPSPWPDQSCQTSRWPLGTGSPRAPFTRGHRPR